MSKSKYIYSQNQLREMLQISHKTFKEIGVAYPEIQHFGERVGRFKKYSSGEVKTISGLIKKFKAGNVNVTKSKPSKNKPKEIIKKFGNKGMLDHGRIIIIQHEKKEKSMARKLFITFVVIMMILILINFAYQMITLYPILQAMF